ncbi:MAG: hypothetical protein DCC88_08960 [Spirobacillus cienkowskii]|jgi:predicted MPP superfamily phosphohydrolase|uniref:Calcineurin-like phosphoesterase domain-containing protein n=1 Tax=Spirobacillus cienkowskii TaxID=495820 RepID=A0A369KM06_9BACT|nr:MAG: hypothetical protein DCC88_08960 [Spirobacillus cienkowskii]
MFLKLLFSIIVALFITVLGHYYLYLRLVDPIFGHNPTWISIFIALWSITFFGFLILRIVLQFLRKIFELIMFIWMGTAFLFIIVCFITSPINIYLQFYGKDTVTLCYFVIISGLLLTLFSVYLALKKPKIIKTEIKVKKNLPAEIKNLQCVILSDIHVSGLIGKKRVKKLTETVNKLEPDLIFLTGDLMDGSVHQLHKEIAPLKELKAKYGVFYITGNHEYYSGPLKWKNHFANVFHWKVLSNTCHTININNFSINILGIEDRHWLSYEKIPKRYDNRLSQAVQHLEHSGSNKKEALNILLAHQPKDSRLLEDYPFIDLQFSGHTHGGQIWPLQFIVKKDQKYVKGLYQINENQQIYVSQGTGFWGPPMRLGTHCEISHITFKQE